MQHSPFAAFAGRHRRNGPNRQQRDFVLDWRGRLPLLPAEPGAVVCQSSAGVGTLPTLVEHAAIHLRHGFDRYGPQAHI